MLRKPDISVVIPVFNTADYLPECLSSLLGQTDLSLELILVDDGSTDGSTQICEEFSVNNSCIQLIKQENRGVSAARNAGLDVATADYIGFVDSDDYILADHFATLLTAARGSCCDIIKAGWWNESPDGTRTIRNQRLPGRTIPGGEEALRAFLQNQLSAQLWAGIYRRSVFAEYRFPEGCIHEDSHFFMQSYWTCESIQILGSMGYVHRLRAGSIMRSPISIARLDGLKAFAALETLLSNGGNQNCLLPLREARRARKSLYLLDRAASEFPLATYREFVAAYWDIVTRRQFASFLSHAKFRTKAHLILFRRSPELFFAVRRLRTALVPRRGIQ